jgi:hypothetical protein
MTATIALVYTYSSSLYTGTTVYKGASVHPTGLTVNQGCSQVSQGSPRALASAGRRRDQRSNLRGRAHWRDGYHCCGDGEGAVVLGRAKTSSLGKKTVLGPS